MKKSFFNTLMACIVIALCLVLFCTIISEPEITGYKEYRVKSGDTLWMVASESNGYNKIDTRKIIDDIEEESGCTAYIYPGQVVYIPIYDI